MNLAIANSMALMTTHEQTEQAGTDGEQQSAMHSFPTFRVLSSEF
jgi:hypothetical protein